MSYHGRHIGFDRSVNSVIRPADPESRTLETNTHQTYCRLKFKMAAGDNVGFGTTGNRSNRSSIAENPTLESNTKWISFENSIPR